MKAGGTAASPKAQVTIAGGALSANITVGVTHADDAGSKKIVESDIRAAAADPAFDVVSSIYSFTPHNQEFASAVTIQFELDSVPGSGLQIDSRPFFEHYPVDAEYDPATGIFTCQLCIPVKPL